MGRKSWLPWLGVIAATAAALAGCEKAQNRKAIVLAPSTRQSPPVEPRVSPAATRAAASSTTRPAGKGATTQAVKKSSWMMVNSIWVEFPEAKLVIRKEGEKLTALLCSNDPPDVLNPNYQGNRYYFELTLDSIDDVKNIAQADFRYKAASAEPQDTPNGIFLDGDRQHFQPYDIQVVFDKDGENIVADIRGQFIYFQKGNIVGQWTPVMATISAKPEVKAEAK
jgi:hypothetical protein